MVTEDEYLIARTLADLSNAVQLLKWSTLPDRIDDGEIGKIVAHAADQLETAIDLLRSEIEIEGVDK